MIQDQVCSIISNQPCGRALWQMRLQPAQGAQSAMAHCRPGQFVMIDLPKEPFYFRRPMSVMAVEPDGTFTIFYKVMGHGTAIFSTLQANSPLNVLGPLGNALGDTLSAPLSPSGGPVLLIGGGIGIAPLIAYGQQLRQQGIPVQCMYGVRSAVDVGVEDLLVNTFGKDNVHIATDDGTQGFHGHVGQLLSSGQSKHQWVTTAQAAMICGPTVMMLSVSELLMQLNPNLPVEVSLEEHMPCGTGACGGCVVFVNDGHLPAKVCVEGPVLNARRIQWCVHQPGVQQPDRLPSCAATASESESESGVSSCQA